MKPWIKILLVSGIAIALLAAAFVSVLIIIWDADFNSELDSNIICRTSANFRNLFEWRGIGKMKEPEKKRLRNYVKQAHASGRKIRFWAATNRKKVWTELLDAGLDWISVDKLNKFRT